MFPTTIPSSAGVSIVRLLGVLAAAAAPSATAGSLIDYFLPIPVGKPLTSSGWGASNVQPRDQDNGLEDKTNKTWSYWDGRILKDGNGKYHMYASRWSQSAGHNGWFGSNCVHAVGDSIRGPYVDKGLCYSDANGQGHNVMVSQLKDGKYFVLVSETRRPAIVYTSSSLDGPWTKSGTVSCDANGVNVDASSSSELHSNTTFWVRPDGSILATARHGLVMLSTNGPLGPFKVQGPSVYSATPTSQSPAVFGEDPVLWSSGGLFHMIYNLWGDRVAYHLTSRDGIHDWVNRGVAFDPQKPFIRHADGTVNKWYKIERPQIYMEDGHVTHFTFSVIDVEKDLDKGGDNHNSKVIVVPFDGKRFDADYGWKPGAYVYRNYSFDGLAAHLPAGSYTRSQLASLGVSDNDISSMKLDSGVSVELFDDDEFRTPLGTFKVDQPNFGNLGFNDKATSMRVTMASTGVRADGAREVGRLRWTPGGIEVPDAASGSLDVVDSRGGIRILPIAQGRVDVSRLPAGVYRMRRSHASEPFQSLVLLP